MRIFTNSCLWLLFFLALCLPQLKAQTQAIRNQLRFEELPTEIGFPNTGVNDILEDHRGFLWMATWSGLAKYDGYSVKMYNQQPGNSNGLKSNKITHLYEDRKGNLWIGTNYTGFYRYNREQDNFEQFCRNPKDMNSLSNDNVWGILEDSDGMLWIGTEKGLNRFDPATGKYVHYFNAPSDSRSLSHDFVYSIAQTTDGTIWVGTEEGLNRLVRNNNEEYFIRYELAPDNIGADEYLPHNFIYKVTPSLYDPQTLWICTSIGLKKVQFSNDDPKQFEYRFYGHQRNSALGLSHPFVPDVLEEDSKQVWVATYNGLNLLDTETGRGRYFNSDKNNPYSIDNNVVKCLSKDRTGNLWIGLDKGLNKLNLNNHIFQRIHLDAPDNTRSSVHCIEPGSQTDRLWLGTRGGGVSMVEIDAHGNKTSKPINYQFVDIKIPELAGFIMDITLDQLGQLWIATDGSGIIKVPEKDLLHGSASIPNFKQYTKYGYLSDDYIMTLLQSTSGYIWIGYWDKGFDRYDPATDIFHHYYVPKDLSVNFQEFPVVHFAETIEEGQEYLWVGTRGGGVYKVRFNPQDNSLILLKHYQSETDDPGSLSNNSINAFHVDSKGRLWAGTDSGLNVLDQKTGTFTSYFEHDGLVNSIIQSILEDDNGNIWVSTQKGISCLYFKGDTLNSIKNFDAFDGLQDNYFNDDAATLGPNNHLIFGGVNGLSLFRPEDVQPDTIAPKIELTDFRLFNKSVTIGASIDGRTILSKSISETPEIELNYRDNVVSFEFTGLHFGEPKKLRYAYQLKGFDPDWVYTDASQRLAHYTNLPYDKYTFKVKASNGDGVWSDPVEVKLRVHPPIWLTPWAYLVYSLLIAGLFFLAIRIIKIRAAYRHSLELERLEREKLEEVNHLKLQFFTNISHELRTPLTLIISPLEQLLQNPKDSQLHQLFTRMHFNANRLLTMINQLLDIRKNEAGLMKLHVSEGDMAAFGKEITDSFRNLAKQRNILLTFEVMPDQILTWFDHDQMEKVLFNLLSNAFKFTKDGGQIEVQIEKIHEQVELSVSDSGVGIPPEQLDKIFTRFYQVENSKEWSRKGGTGIGLSLAKMIVEKHSGEIKVESEEGVGTTFCIQLPLGKDQFSESELMPAEQSHPTQSAFALTDTFVDLPRPAEDTELLEQNEQEDKPQILVVEDNADIRAYLRENFEDEYHISEAADGKEGLDMAIANPPDLIVADIAMPRMDGIELCGKIKSQIETSHIPVILLTARTSLVFKVDGLETGADDYVTKPFHMRLLAARIKNLINSRKALRAHFSKNLDLSPSAISLNSLDEQLLAQIKLIIERHIDDSDFSVDQLASALNISRMQLYRKLKSLTGKSPNQIIRSFRLKRAAQLLEQGQYNVSDVTYMVGYNDLKSFREQFKKEFGVSPSRYTG